MANTNVLSDNDCLEIALDKEAEMIEKIEMVGRGYFSGVIVSGPPGCGKSKTVTDILKSMPDLEHVSDVHTEQDSKGRWQVIGKTVEPGPLVRKSRYAPWSLTRDLYRNSARNNKLVIDDNDIALQDLNFCSLLMNATEQDALREVHYNAKKITELECEGVPDKFDYAGGIVILTNYNMRNIPAQGEKGHKKYHERWAALVSRLSGQYVDMSMEDRVLINFLEHRIRITKQLTKSSYFNTTFNVDGITEDQQEELFSFARYLLGNSAFIQNLDLRVYNTMASYIIMSDGDSEKWKKQIKRNLVTMGFRDV